MGFISDYFPIEDFHIFLLNFSHSALYESIKLYMSGQVLLHGLANHLKMFIWWTLGDFLWKIFQCSIDLSKKWIVILHYFHVCRFIMPLSQTDYYKQENSGQRLVRMLTNLNEHPCSKCNFLKKKHDMFEQLTFLI